MALVELSGYPIWTSSIAPKSGSRQIIRCSGVGGAHSSPRTRRAAWPGLAAGVVAALPARAEIRTHGPVRAAGFQVHSRSQQNQGLRRFRIRFLDGTWLDPPICAFVGRLTTDPPVGAEVAPTVRWKASSRQVRGCFKCYSGDSL